MSIKQEKKIRLDSLLVQREIYLSQDEARRACLAGEVTSPQVKISTPSQLVSPDIELHIKPQRRFVSRGGEKLASALSRLDFNPEGLKCIDVGASTGGFTDCLLQHGAAKVVAVDVGYGQFSWKLRNNSKVDLFERTNIRNANLKELGAPFDLLVADLSFTTLSSLLETFKKALSFDGHLLIMVKPQFELDSSMVGEHGVVRDFAAHKLAIQKVVDAMLDSNFVILGACASSIKGPKGNSEFFLLATLNASQVPQVIDYEGMINKAVEQAHKSKGDR